MKVAISFLGVMACAMAGAVEVNVDWSTAIGPVKPVNGVGQPPMVGACDAYPMFHYLKEAGIPFARLHDVGGWLGGGLYVDIPNVFPDFDADETDPKSYRFAFTDTLMKALDDNGIEPVFRLGVTIENFVYYAKPLPAQRIDPPKDFAKWGRICERIIRHYTEGWADGYRLKARYWEIWNEPENDPNDTTNPMFRAPFSEYMRLYGTVAPYLKAKFPHLKIGGYGHCGFYAGVGAGTVKAANSSPRKEYFVECSHRFLKAARDNGWPLDFFSYHSYSDPVEALRQVRFADEHLNEYGFTRAKTERMFNEWLPFVSQSNLGTAKQAAAIAAELIGLQNGPCDSAMIYDARCGIGSYAPLFNPLTYKPHKAYYAFMAFNELRKLGQAVPCTSGDADLWATAAKGPAGRALMLANYTTRTLPLTLKDDVSTAVARVTDAARTWQKAVVPKEIGPETFLVIVWNDDTRAEAAQVAQLPEETPDPRVRSLVMPRRVVWTSDGSGGFGERSKVTGAETLLQAKRGQTPERGWTKEGIAYGCHLVNDGEAPGILLDFGRELHGGLQIVCGRGVKGMRVRVRFGESVSEAMSSIGEKHATNDHAIRDGVIDVPAFGVREIGNTGFRFARLDLVTTGSIKLEAVRAVSLMRPMARQGCFRCSDLRLNAIYETAIRTAHLCCQEYLWDGIKRDRLVWMGDTHPETMAIIGAFGAAEIIPQSLTYAAETTPTDAWMNTMPCYTLWWIRNLAEWYRYTGDRLYLQQNAAYLKDTVRHVLASLSPSNTWDAAGFLDWPTKHNPAAVDAGKQALAKIAFDEAAFLGEALKDDELTAVCKAASRRLSSLRLEPHGAKTAAALLALSGLRDAKEMFAESLGKDGHAGVSTFYGYYMLEAMSAAGENQRALDTVRDYWGAMLDVGATSFWEDFNIAWTNNCFRIDELPVAGKKDVHGDYGEFCYPGFRHSLCHGWSAGPAAWLISHVLGIQPKGVGCTAFDLKPFLGDLEWAEGEFPTPIGPFRVRIEKKADGTLDVNYTAAQWVKVNVIK